MTPTRATVRAVFDVTALHGGSRQDACPECGKPTLCPTILAVQDHVSAYSEATIDAYLKGATP